MSLTRTANQLLRVSLFLAMAVGLMGAQCPSSQVVLGDADGDAQLTDADVEALLLLITDTSGPSSEPDPHQLDVALPCEGEVDMEDMRRLRGALASQSLGIPTSSRCHEGGIIGEAYEPDRPAPDPKWRTLDQKFRKVAVFAPQFGGLYLDDGVLNIVVTDVSPDVAQQAEDAANHIFGDRFEGIPVQIIQGRYSFEQLFQWRMAARDILFLPMVHTVDVDEMKNQVVVGLEDLADAAAVHAELVTFYGEEIPADAVRYEQVEQAVDYAFVDDLRAKERPLQGGLQTASPGTCTLGIVAKRNGVVGHLTNSHCTAVRGQTDGSAFGQPNSNSGNAIGVEVADAPAWSLGCPGGLCTWADAAFVQLNQGVTAYRGRLKQDPAVTGWYVTGYVRDQEYFPVGGELLHKVGRTTGQSAGIVDQTCVDMVTTWVKLCQYRVMGAASAGGDSGSPVFMPWSPGSFNVTLYGLLHSGATQAGGNYYWFSSLGSHRRNDGRYQHVQRTDEPPTVTITAPVHASQVGPGIFPPATLIARLLRPRRWSQGCSHLRGEVDLAGRLPDRSRPPAVRRRRSTVSARSSRWARQAGFMPKRRTAGAIQDDGFGAS